jgi:hypothetical protein
MAHGRRKTSSVQLGLLNGLRCRSAVAAGARIPLAPTGGRSILGIVLGVHRQAEVQDVESRGGGGANSSPTYHVRTDDGDDNVNIHLFGDTQTLSDENIYNGSALVKQLQSKMKAQLPQEDLILHVGDMTDDLTDIA